MKANKRIRDLGRRSIRRLVSLHDGILSGTTTFPLNKKDKDGKQSRNGVKLQWR